MTDERTLSRRNSLKGIAATGALLGGAGLASNSASAFQKGPVLKSHSVDPCKQRATFKIWNKTGKKLKFTYKVKETGKEGKVVAKPGKSKNMNTPWTYFKVKAPKGMATVKLYSEKKGKFYEKNGKNYYGKKKDGKNCVNDGNGKKNDKKYDGKNCVNDGNGKKKDGKKDWKLVAVARSDLTQIRDQGLMEGDVSLEFVGKKYDKKDGKKYDGKKDGKKYDGKKDGKKYDGKKDGKKYDGKKYDGKKDGRKTKLEFRATNHTDGKVGVSWTLSEDNNNDDYVGGETLCLPKEGSKTFYVKLPKDWPDNGMTVQLHYNDHDDASMDIGPVYNKTQGTLHATLQEAIDEADPNDTIKTFGDQNEHITIDKALNVIGVKKPTLPEGVTIEADNVTLRGFNIENDDGPGVFLEPGISNIRILGNRISASAQAIVGQLPGGLEDLRIEGNRLHSSQGPQVVYIHGEASGGTNAQNVYIVNNRITADDLDGGLAVGLEADGGNVAKNVFDDPPTTFGHLELWGPNIDVKTNKFLGENLGPDAFYVTDSDNTYDLDAILENNTFDPAAEVVDTDIVPQ